MIRKVVKAVRDDLDPDAVEMVARGQRRFMFVPRDWAGSFDPQLIATYQRRFPGFDDKIISMYAQGMSMRETAEHLREI